MTIETPPPATLLSVQQEGRMRRPIGWLVTVGDHLLLTQRPRSLALTALLTLVPASLMLVVFSGRLFQPVPFINDGHASIELDEAIVARYCGRPGSMSSRFRISSDLRADDALMTMSFPDLLGARAGSIGGFCRSVDVDFLNNENSLGLVMRLGLWVLPHPSARSLLYFLDAFRLACVLFTAFALLCAGASIMLAWAAAWALTQLGVDLAQFDFSVYSFFVPLLAATISAYVMLWRQVRRRPEPWLVGGALLMGFATAFCANMRSSHLPIYIALFFMFVAAVYPFIRTKRALTIVFVFTLFMTGYAAFTRMFISPMVPKGSQSLSYHVIFHPLVLALGIPENPLSRREGITWDDAVGPTLARRMIPDAVYLEPSYEKALCLYYVKLWLLYPSEMRGIYLEKFRLAGTGMFSRRPGAALEPMTQMLRHFARSPSGLQLLAAYLVIACVGAGFFLWGRNPLLLFLCGSALVAVLMQIEAGFIYSYFYPQYDGYLLVFTFLLGPIAAQVVLDVIGEGAARTGSPPTRSSDALLQRRTIDDFGEQWTAYVDNSGYYGSADLFNDAMHPFVTAAAIKATAVAEIGAGTGRFINIFLDAGAKHVVAVEPSEAASVLERNIPQAWRDRVEIVRGTGETIPGHDRFDYVFSIGVLHHIVDPDPVCRAAFRALRPGGTIGIWVYGREGNGVYLAVVEPMRWVTKRLPHAALAVAVWVMGWGLDAYISAARVLPLPMRDYARNVLRNLAPDKRRLVIYDQLNPAFAKYYTRSEAEALLSRAGFRNVRSHHRHGYSWSVVGEKPA